MRDFWEMAKIIFRYLALPMGATAILLTVLYNLLAPMNWERPQPDKQCSRWSGDRCRM